LHNKIKIPCLFSATEVSKDTSLIPVELTLLHDNENRNYSSIELDVIKKASDSIKNKPILAYIKREDGNVDFGGHDVEIVLGEDDAKFIYLERPVGIIPESTKIDFFEKDGKTYMTCTGYIYREYGNETYDLLSDSKSKCVSVEIDVLDIDLKEDSSISDIKEFIFLGVTILSDEKVPGMDENCTIKLSSTDEPEHEGENNPFAEFIEKAKKEVANFEKNIDKSDIDEGEPDGTDEPLDEPKTDNLDEPIDGEPDAPLDDIDVNKFEIFKDLFNVEIDSMEQLKTLFVEAIEEYSNTQAEMEEELESLRAFKNEYDINVRKAEVDSLLEEFNFETDEISDLVQKAYSFELDIEDLRNQLYILVGKKTMKNKNAKKFEKTKIEIFSTKETPKNKEDIYGGILDGILGYK